MMKQIENDVRANYEEDIEYAFRVSRRGSYQISVKPRRPTMTDTSTDVISCDACKTDLPATIDLPAGERLDIQCCPVCGTVLNQPDDEQGGGSA